MKTGDVKYRPDIDGIRGIAVLLVVIFHAAPTWLPGGFIGVDVFFVISGYLISSIIFREVSENRFSLARFYARRVKRIFPALATMLIVVLIAGWIFLFGSEFRNLGKHVVGGTGFVSNLLYWRETDYFNASAESKPLLHLWSLGIEEQFYIFFPIGVWLLRGLRNRGITYAIGCLLVISLAISYVGTEMRPVATFYLPFTRTWELLVGCLLASVQHESSSKPIEPDAKSTERSQSRNLFTIVGTSMVVGPAFWITSNDPFPGVWALWPTIGTALMIAAGKHCSTNARLLGNKLLVAVGLISYPLYLWHWPALFFARTLSPEQYLGTAVPAAVIVSFALSWLTYRYIEQPIRFHNLLGARVVLILGAVVSAIAVAGGCAFTGILPSRLASNPLSQEFDAAVGDWDFPFDSNFQRSADFVVADASGEEQLGNADFVLFVGDSHMEQYWPRIEVARDSLGNHSKRIRFLTAGGSPTLPNVNNLAPGYECQEFYEFSIQAASKEEVSSVVFCCFWEGYFPAKNGDPQPGSLFRVGDKDRTPLAIGHAATKQVFQQFGEDIRGLVQGGKSVHVILSGPSSPNWSPRSMSRFSTTASTIERWPVSEQEIEGLVGPIANAITEVVETAGGNVIDPRRMMLENGFFYGRDPNGRFRYKDHHHMRPFYVIETATFIDGILKLKPR